MFAGPPFYSLPPPQKQKTELANSGKPFNGWDPRFMPEIDRPRRKKGRVLREGKRMPRVMTWEINRESFAFFLCGSSFWGIHGRGEYVWTSLVSRKKSV